MGGIRDYWTPKTMWNRAVGHYYSWIPITDTFVLWLEPNRRGWWIPFRFLAGIQLIVFNSVFVIFSEETLVWPWNIMANARFILIIIQIIQSIYLFKTYGPKLQNLAAPIQCICKREVPPIHLMMLSFISLFAGNVIYKLHWNYGFDFLDGPLTNFQTNNAITVLLKSVFLDVMIKSNRLRACAHFFVAALAGIQWLFIIELFQNAPIPYGHAAFELSCVVSGIVLLYKSN